MVDRAIARGYLAPGRPDDEIRVARTLRSAAPIPVVIWEPAGRRLIAERHHLTLYDRDGNQPLKGVVVPPLAGWLQACEAGRHRAALIAGTGIGLDTGEPGLLAAVRGGRVVGATVATHPIDEREHVHVLIVKWRTEGKVARLSSTDAGTVTRMPSWEEFRPRLTRGQEVPPW
jgi:hypothetical protein